MQIGENSNLERKGRAMMLMVTWNVLSILKKGPKIWDVGPQKKQNFFSSLSLLTLSFVERNGNRKRSCVGPEWVVKYQGIIMYLTEKEKGPF